jgi:hypothetical protein
MSVILRFALATLAFCLATPFSTHAKSKGAPPPPPAAPLATPAPEPPPFPPQAAPKITPGAPPSASLQPFLDIHLGQILAPLGTAAFTQSELIAGMKASYADGLASASDVHKSAFQLAQEVCDALSAAIAERQNAVAALRGALASRSSEASQPRGGGEAVDKARNRDAFFVAGQQDAWVKRAAALRESITALDLRERAAERTGAWPAAPSTPAVTAAGPALPAPGAPAAPAVPEVPPDQDPAIGNWLLEGRTVLTFGADHTVTGGRHGTWRYVGMEGGRKYEIHFPAPKNWSDWLILSADVKTLDGHTRGNQHIAYYRQ